MPKIDCIKLYLDDICSQFCTNAGECPEEAECYYRIQMREIIENLLDDYTDNGVDKA